MKRAFGLLIGALLCCSLQAFAKESPERFEISLPKDYCALDLTRDKDSFLQEYLQKVAGRSLRIASIALPCIELKEYRSSIWHLPQNFIFWSQVGIDGAFTRFLLGKGVYANLITSFSPDKSLNRIEERTNRKLEPYGDKTEHLYFKVEGAHNGVVVIEGSAEVVQAQGTQILTMSAATTLVEKYPWAVIKGSTEGQSASLNELQALLKSIHQD